MNWCSTQSDHCCHAVPYIRGCSKSIEVHHRDISRSASSWKDCTVGSTAVAIVARTASFAVAVASSILLWLLLCKTSSAGNALSRHLKKLMGKETKKTKQHQIIVTFLPMTWRDRGTFC